MDSIYRIFSAYKRMDKTIARFKAATGIRCRDGCRSCCMSGQVEASILEVLPLAMEIYSRRKEEEVMTSLRKKETDQDLSCVLLLAEPPRNAKGSCGYYDFRPLLCRLFGFASRKNKYYRPEFSPCNVIRTTEPEAVRRAEIAVSEGLNCPVYQDAFIRIATIPTWDTACSPSIKRSKGPLNVSTG
jgi:Fe-S-cluster containining protein